MQPERLERAFGLLLALTLGLIVLGALVRANGAGLACPDWPLCFGKFVPKLDLRVGFEWTHRLVAGSISLLFVLFGVWVWRGPTTRQSTRRLLVVAGVLLGAQVLLGALTVWKLLAAWTVTSHLLTGNAFAVSLLWITLSLHDTRAPTSHAPASTDVRWIVSLAFALLLLQMILGGLVASHYAGLACPEWPACNGGFWFPSWGGTVGLHLLHRWNAMLVLSALLAAAIVARDAHPGLRRLLWGTLALGGGQVLIGITNVLTGLPVEVTGLHSALATGLVLTLSAAVRDCWRSSSPA